MPVASSVIIYWIIFIILKASYYFVFIYILFSAANAFISSITFLKLPVPFCSVFTSSALFTLKLAFVYFNQFYFIIASIELIYAQSFFSTPSIIFDLLSIC